jgi:hypothetical protein
MSGSFLRLVDALETFDAVTDATELRIWTAINERLTATTFFEVVVGL